MATEKSKKQIAEEILEERQPGGSSLAHVLTFAYASARYGISQDIYSEVAGFSARTLRKHISNNRAEFDTEYQRVAEDLKKEQGITKRQLSGSELDAFLDILIQKAIDPNGSTADRKLLSELVSISSEDLLTRQTTKQASLLWFIRNNLENISTYLTPRELGLHIEESPYIYRETRESKGNSQRFIDNSVFSTEDKPANPSYIVEVLYWGVIFLSLMNQQAHPDVNLLGDTVRLARATDGKIKTARELRKVARYAKGKNMFKRTTPVTAEEVDKLLLELNSDNPDYKLPDIKTVTARKPVELPDREAVIQRVTTPEAQEQLELILSADDLMAKLLGRAEQKEY